MACPSMKQEIAAVLRTHVNWEGSGHRAFPNRDRGWRRRLIHAAQGRSLLVCHSVGHRNSSTSAKKPSANSPSRFRSLILNMDSGAPR